ncbi:MAG: dTDP-4-dehydrorhamnose 3,5-epimerase [Alphaproteobacteria bacterium]|nr:dTDP-4-dehydrorhamnose 3,5-epimerase [Alphaproteobacteria bacterium]
MIFKDTTVEGVYLVEAEPCRDTRGYFARTWCQSEFERRGLNASLVQCSTSYNENAGTLRGLHYQAPPHMEAKLVRCTRGALFDVVVDLRKESASYGKWAGFELSAENGHMVYIPEGLAHGFQTLVPETEIFYQISTHYAPDCAAGIRWDDPDLAIDWPPVAQRVISERDAQHPGFADTPPLPYPN